MTNDLQRHGTYAGYQQHRKRGEIVCPDCREARNAWERGRREARRRAADLAELTATEAAALFMSIGYGNSIEYVQALIANRIIRAERLLRDQ